MPEFDRVPPAKNLPDAGQALVALVTSGAFAERQPRSDPGFQCGQICQLFIGRSN